MARFFDKLFDIELLHDYYTSGKSRDFILSPTADTIQLIKGYRSLIKNRASDDRSENTVGLSVVYEATDNAHTPLIPINQNERFRFAMKLVNPTFLNFTDIPAKNNSNEIYYYHNNSGSPLTQEVLELQPKVFTYRVTSAFTPDNLKVFGIDGSEITALQATLSGGPDFEVELDLSGYPDGKYKLELFDGITSTGESQDIYFDNALKAEGVFGIVEIYKANNDFPHETLQIQFNKSEVYWKYFVLVKAGDIGTDTYEVIDAEDYSGGGTAIEFSKVDSGSYTAADDAVVAALLNQHPDGEVVLIKSDTLIAYSESKKTDLQLRKNGQFSPPLTSHLPNPAVANPKAESFVFI